MRLAIPVLSLKIMTKSSEEIRCSDAGRAQDLASLEEFVRDLAGTPGEFNALLCEHLDAARFYLHGSMPVEYNVTLTLAAHLLPSIENNRLRARLKEFLLRQRQNVV